MGICRREFTALLGSLAVAGFASPVAADAKTVGVTIAQSPENRFVPATLNVAIGDTVKWINNSGGVHTATFNSSMAANAKDAQVPDGVVPFDSGDIAPGATFSHTFTAKGTYKYFCGYHEGMGMVGTVIVS